MGKIKVRKDVVEEMIKKIEKSNPNHDAFGRFTFGKKILAPDTGANGSVSNNNKNGDNITYTEMNCVINDDNKRITKRLKVRDDLVDFIKNGKVFYKFPRFPSKTQKRNFVADKLCDVIKDTEIKEPEKEIKNTDAYLRVQLQQVQNIFAKKERGKCKALNNRKVKVEYKTVVKHLTDKTSEEEKRKRGKAIRFIPEIVEDKGYEVGCELVESPKGFAALRHDIVGKCEIDGVEYWVSVILVDKPDNLLQLTIFTDEIQKSFRHDTSVGIIGDSSTGRASLESISKSSFVYGIDNSSMPITLGRVVKTTNYKGYEHLYNPSKINISQQNNLSSKKVIKSLTYSGHKLQGRTRLYGMDISIENKKGSCRSGTDKDGHKWRTYMNYDYGYIRGTVGVDKDHLDCYIGPDKNAEKVYVIHQNDPVTHKYDEDKCMLCFSSAADAKKAYMKQYDRPGFYGSMTTMTIDEFKSFIFSKKGKMIHKSFDIQITDITENNKQQKLEQFNKALNAIANNQPFVIKHIPADGSQRYENLTVRLMDFDKSKIEKAVHKVALSLDADISGASKGESFVYKSQEEIVDKYFKEFTNRTRAVYNFVISYFDLPDIRIVSKAGELRHKGKILYNPSTGLPIKESEWKKFVIELEKFLNRNYTGIGEKIVLSAESLGIILDRLSKTNSFDAVKKMTVSDLKAKRYDVDWISDSVKNMKDKFGEVINRERQARIQIACDSAAQRVTRVKDDMRNNIQQIIIDGIRDKQSKSVVAQNLFDKCASLNRDMQRIADSEVQMASNSSYCKEEVYNSKPDEKVYFKRFEIIDDNTCKECKKLNGRIVLWSDVPLPDEHIKDPYADYAIWEGKNEGSCPVGTVHPWCRGTWTRYYPDLD